jgi:hypothetical protein
MLSPTGTFLGEDYDFDSGMSLNPNWLERVLTAWRAPFSTWQLRSAVYRQGKLKPSEAITIFVHLREDVDE